MPFGYNRPQQQHLTGRDLALIDNPDEGELTLGNNVMLPEYSVGLGGGRALVVRWPSTMTEEEYKAFASGVDHIKEVMRLFIRAKNEPRDMFAVDAPNLKGADDV